MTVPGKYAHYPFNNIHHRINIMYSLLKDIRREHAQTNLLVKK